MSVIEGSFVPCAQVPDEIALEIFSYLDLQSLSRCQAVNSVWRCLAEDAQFIKISNLNEETRSSIDIKKIASRGSLSEELRNIVRQTMQAREESLVRIVFLNNSLNRSYLCSIMRTSAEPQNDPAWKYHKILLCSENMPAFTPFSEAYLTIEERRELNIPFLALETTEINDVIFHEITYIRPPKPSLLRRILFQIF